MVPDDDRLVNVSTGTDFFLFVQVPKTINLASRGPKKKKGQKEHLIFIEYWIIDWLYADSPPSFTYHSLQVT